VCYLNKFDKLKYRLILTVGPAHYSVGMSPNFHQIIFMLLTTSAAF